MICLDDFIKALKEIDNEVFKDIQYKIKHKQTLNILEVEYLNFWLNRINKKFKKNKEA